MDVGVLLPGKHVDQVRIQTVLAQHVPAPTLLSAWEKNANGIRIPNLGMKTRIIVRTVAPLPARSLRTQSCIEAGSARQSRRLHRRA